MTLFNITVCHMEPEIVAWSLMRYKRTTSVLPANWIMLDNAWPINKVHVLPNLLSTSRLVDSTVIVAEKNLGGHGGVTYALEELKKRVTVSPSDYVLIYDPDSNPVTDKWLESMIKVLNTDLTVGYVSLLGNWMTDRPWTFEEIGGQKVAFLSYPEMWNVTLFRASLLDKGMQSDAAKWGAEFYGHVEPPMFRYARENGMRNGYMFDCREDKCLIPHPRAYSNWKQEHAYGKFRGNFDQYCSERGIK